VSLARAKALDRRLGAPWAGALAALDRVVEAVRTPAPVEDVRHVLVTKLWGVGNWALLRPIVHDLRARYPAARFSLLTLTSNLPLVSDLADTLLLVRPQGVVAAALDLARAVRRLRQDPPDLALDFEAFAHAGALAARLGRARQRIGFATPGRLRQGLYTALVPWRTDAHASRSFRDLAESGGLAPAPYRAGGLEATAAGREATASWRASGPYALVHPGSGDNFPGRRWSEAGFAAVARTLVARGARVFVAGSAAEADLAARVAASAGPGAESLAGRLTLEGLVALVAEARLLVSNDTGPVHLASALGVRTLALFGPNTPVLYGPLAPGSRAFYRELACSPCLTASSQRSSRCRLFTCMASIPVGEVVEAAARALSAAREAAGART
jgi:ADP-heptose:LPS heptosyltransferase